MLKIKGTSCPLVDIPSKRKRVPWHSSDDKKGNIDCSSPNMLIQSMLGDTKVDDFFDNYWEKKHLLVRRADPKFYGELLTLSVIKDVVKVNELNFLLDVEVGAYVGGQKKDFFEENGRVTVEAIDRLMDQSKATFQFYHPQRYVDELWNIVEKIETYFGCLVGTNAYITPPGCQGSAPHCDDVENFIFQIEGKAAWKIYKPLVELSRDFTQDLLADVIGEPIMQCLLEPGDLLYFPRGEIYQFQSTDNSHSTHVAVSTYQQNTWGDFMCHAVQQAIENALEDDVSIRTGLPINYQSFLGTGRNMSAYITDPDDEKNESENKGNSSNLCDPKVVKFKESIQSCLSKLVDHIDVNKAADSMCAEYMGSRLPPYGHKGVCTSDGEMTVDKTTPVDDTKTRPEAMEGDTITTAGMEEDSTTPAAMEEDKTTAAATAVVGGDITTPAAAVVAVDGGDITTPEVVAVDGGDVTTQVVVAVDGGDVTTQAVVAVDADTPPASITENKITPAAGKSCDAGMAVDEAPANDDTCKKVIATINDKIKIKYPDHIRVVYADEDEDDFDDDDDDESMDDSTVEDMEQDINEKEESEQKPKDKSAKKAVKLPSETCDDEDDGDAEVTDTEPHIKVLHSLFNNRFSHMGFNVYDKVGCLKFDVTYAKALVKLMKSNGFVAVKDLEMEEDEEKVLLATRLAGDGVVEVGCD